MNLDNFNIFYILAVYTKTVIDEYEKILSNFSTKLVTPAVKNCREFAIFEHCISLASSVSSNKTRITKSATII